MSNSPIPARESPPEPEESFGEMLSQFEQTHARPAQGHGQQIRGTVIAVSADTVFVDIGFKTEGVLPLASIVGATEAPGIGDKLTVSVKGRNPEGYYELSRIPVQQPKDWTALEKAFADGSVILGTVTTLVKGGVTVDVGVRAFLPASRSGTRDAAELEKLVGQEIRCRITKLDQATEDVVLDRRVVAEEDDRASKDRRYAEVNVGDIVTGTVRSLTEYGAFMDLGGVDGLLHIGEISWARVSKVEDLLVVGQQLDVKVLRIEPETRRIAVSLRQLLPHPWDAIVEKYKVGDRVHGAITRLTDFGAFLELEPGIEGMIHVSEMSWGRKVRKPEDVLSIGERVEVVILRIELAERRLALGLKQALGDPWLDAAGRLTVGSIVEGEITSMTKFGAFLELAQGVQGMVHISEISAERRLNHPSDVLRLGEHVKAKVLEVDPEKRQLRLSIKQLAPTGLEDFFAEQHKGDTVTGRILFVQGDIAQVELGEGVIGQCTLPASTKDKESAASGGLADLTALTSMLHARWKSGTTPSATPAPVLPGQVRSFRIEELTPDTATIVLRLTE